MAGMKSQHKITDLAKQLIISFPCSKLALVFRNGSGNLKHVFPIPLQVVAALICSNQIEFLLKKTERHAQKFCKLE
ncbi:hypothetical protein CDAR_575911 [Caerostris darwini]|uniref:Uncharacterized protein n=1 Tax=Caerostris darwini TaxID=1538125 RepID=A0AAV4X9X5_9ARAC|nr:hypothetical protein CDAR_575911 [Caerostris darwini]